ncbi:MAG: hypothetical protein J6N18_02965, partial [Kiritimatiellae bacterium]|nr:hypothetical protein [Kiritimatiellia bacterium]
AEKGKEKQKEQSVQKGMKKGKGMQKGKEFDWSGFGLGEKRILAKEILGACEGTAMSLAAQLETRINPDYTPPIRVLGDVPSMHIARGNLDRDELHSASGHCKGKFG